MSLSAAALYLSLVTETNAFLRLLWSSLSGCVGEGTNAMSQEPATSLPFLKTGRPVTFALESHGTGGSSVWDPAPPPPEDLFLLLFFRNVCGRNLVCGADPVPPSPSSTDTGCPFAASLQAQGQGNDWCPVEFLWQEGSGKFSVDLASTLWAVMLLSIPYPVLASLSLSQVS